MQNSNNPMLWVPSGYFTMALGYNLLTAAAVIMFSNLGLDNARAAEYASALGLAYTIKPLFAAFVEMYRSKKFFVLLTQILLGLGLLGVAASLQLPNAVTVMMGLFWVLSFIGSVQDIATDGVYVTALDGKSQARFCGIQSLSWNLGKLAVMSVLIGLTGVLHQHVFKQDPSISGPAWLKSWQIIFAALGLLMLVMAAWHARVMPEGARAAQAPANAAEALATLSDAFSSFFRKRGIWLMIGFALLFRISFGFLNAPSLLFMKDSLTHGGLGLSNQAFGLIYGTFGIAALLLGSLVGGAYVARKGLQKSLFMLCCCVNIPNVTFLLMAIYQPQNTVLISLAVIAEQFFFGVGSVGFMIYLMQQLAPGKYATSHYAFGTGLMGLCMMLTGLVSGHLQQSMGYTAYFAFVMLATIPSFLICWFAPFPHPEQATPI